MMKLISRIPMALALGALVATPALAAAQGAAQQEQQQQQEQQKERKPKAEKGAHRIQKQLSFPLANGCRYTANVQGTLTPAQKGAQGAAAAGQEHVTPNLNVSAVVTCPGAADIRVSDNVVSQQPIARSELEEMLEKRASISTMSDNRMCIYLPELNLQEDDLTGSGVAFLCRVPLPAQPGQQPAQEPGRQGMLP